MNNSIKIMIVDGQGGKIGKLLVQELKKIREDLFLLAIGTNSIATAAMLKAGADAGATGENPIVVNSQNASIIIGPIGIIMANSLYGEITPKMAEAISNSNAKKILIPISKCNTLICGTSNLKLENLICDCINKINATIENKTDINDTTF